MPPIAKHKVLVTGFGPFGRFTVNPSWLAADLLHGTVVFTNDPRPESIEITSIQVPTVYQSVLDIVPGLHASPPVLPPEFADRQNQNQDSTQSQTPYSLILHIGVAGPGAMRFETLGHKTGYGKPDYHEQMADVVDASTTPPLRGFAGDKYAKLPEELGTLVAAEAIVGKLKRDGVDIRISTDAGHYLCDFITYCSLAESKIRGNGVPVIFIHCPPVGEPLTPRDVADVVRDIVIEACSRMK